MVRQRPDLVLPAAPVVGPYVVRRFKQVPRIEGQRGFDHQVYGAQRRKRLARVPMQRVPRWIWVGARMPRAMP